MSSVEREMTPAQIAASQANGKKSKGPTTPEGKARVSLNALKTGAYAEQERIGNREQGIGNREEPHGASQSEPQETASGAASSSQSAVATKPLAADVEAAFRPASSPQSTVATEQCAADEPTDRSGGASLAQNAENLSENPSTERKPVVAGSVASKNEKMG
ncbi:MAG: hypothetical protein ACLQOO_03840, partial [Terriglobia bacterium]